MADVFSQPEVTSNTELVLGAAAPSEQAVVVPFEFVAPPIVAEVARPAKEEFGYIEVEVPRVANDAAFAAMHQRYHEFLSGLTFRRVGSVSAKPEDTEGVAILTANADGSLSKQVFTKEDVTTQRLQFSPQVAKQNLVEYWKSFLFFTKPAAKGAPLTKNDPCPDKAILGTSDHYAELDLLTLSFVPRKCTIPPRKDETEMVCGTVEFTRKGPRYVQWFTCTEQFYRAVQLILEPSKYFNDVRKTRKACDATIPAVEDPEMRAWLFAGNTLSTNAYRRFLRGCFDSGVIPDHSELQKRYWTHEFRTENYARCCHTYAALVLLLVYREWPCAYNVPNNNDLGPRSAGWDLPDPQFIPFLANQYGLECDGLVTRKIKYVTNLPRVPVGTHLPTPAELALVESRPTDRSNEVEVPYLDDTNFPPLPNRPPAVATE